MRDEDSRQIEMFEQDRELIKTQIDIFNIHYTWMWWIGIPIKKKARRRVIKKPFRYIRCSVVYGNRRVMRLILIGG